MKGKSLFNKTMLLSVCMLVVACSATQAPPYEADKAPEDRENYSGAKGLMQQQKDQSYMAKKELSDKCEQAKVSQAVAIKEGNREEAQKQQVLIDRTCV